LSVSPSFERLERQEGDLGDQRALIALVEQVRTIAEAVRQAGLDV
jgi:type II secretory pathway component PulM